MGEMVKLADEDGRERPVLVAEHSHVATLSLRGVSGRVSKGVPVGIGSVEVRSEQHGVRRAKRDDGIATVILGGISRLSRGS
jgi:hypothetical protein